MNPTNPTHGQRQFPETLVREYLVSAATREFEKVCYLIESIGLHPDSTLQGKPTALCYAVLNPSHCLMKYLLAKGAYINHRDVLKMTPLHYAVMGGCEFCISFLVKNGARLNTANSNGQTPLGIAISRPRLASCCEYLTRLGGSTHEAGRLPEYFH